MVHVVQLNMLSMKFILVAVKYFAVQKSGSWHKVHETAIFLSYLLLPGTELSLIAESFGFLSDLLPFLSILDASCPVFYLHLINVLFDVILPSVLGSSL